MVRLATVFAILLVLGLPSGQPGSALVAAQQTGSAHPSGAIVHHYTIDGAARPLLFFWISRSDVGAATITWRRDSGETDYSLLIGSDPSRAPRDLNRWGYIDERLRGTEATILGLMTQSDEQSLDEAKANVEHAAGDPQAFRVIRESVDDRSAQAAVTTLGTAEHYTFKQLDAVLAKIPATSAFDHHRRLTLTPGTEPGFLAAVVRLIDETLTAGSTTASVDPPSPIQYVYYGKLYRLRMTDLSRKDELAVDGRRYQHLLDATFEIHNIETGDDTDFEITYGTGGALRGIPVTVQYQPRWWLRLKLRLND